jgi:TonB family protein
MSTTFLGALSADRGTDRVTDRVVNRVIDGRFPLLQRLGGTEWSSAHLTVLDDGRAQRAAIKIFSYRFVDERATLARWDVARTLSHPHLMPLFHAGRCAVEGEDLLYVVTEYADETLSQLLPDRPLSPREAREMLGPVLGALSYLHNRCLTHGHLRPTNIMVIDDQVKLSPDFGWRSRARSIYDAPETGTLYVAPAADIWSLGILLVEALTQQPPAWDRSHGSEPEIPASIPEPFFTICRECLRTDPKRRCTLAGIKARLNSSHVEEPAVQPAVQPAAQPSVAIADRPAKPSYKLHAKIIAGAVVLLLLTVAAFSFGWNLTPSSPTPAPQPQVAELNAAPAPDPATVPAPSAAPAAELSPIAAPVPAPSAAPAPSPAAESSQGGTVKGSVTHQAMPEIPAKIIATVHGHFKVQIRVAVDPEGNVSQASIGSSGPSSYFANQALHAAESWKFAPAKVNGRAVPSAWLLLFQFGQSQSAVTQSEESP